MNVDELLSANRELTDEEYEFLEQELLKTLREFNQHVQGMCEQIGEKDPELAARLKRSAESALSNAEQAAAIPLRASQGADGPATGGAPRWDPAGERGYDT